MYMLDTSFCIYVLKNRSGKLRYKFNTVRDICISAVTYAELCAGIENGRQSLRQQRWEQLDAFTGLLKVLPLDKKAGRSYGAIRSYLQRHGALIGNNDLMVGAHAASAGAVLVTRHAASYSCVPDLTVEVWL